MSRPFNRNQSDLLEEGNTTNATGSETTNATGSEAETILTNFAYRVGTALSQTLTRVTSNAFNSETEAILGYFTFIFGDELTNTVTTVAGDEIRRICGNGLDGHLAVATDSETTNATDSETTVAIGGETEERVVINFAIKLGEALTDKLGTTLTRTISDETEEFLINFAYRLDEELTKTIALEMGNEVRRIRENRLDSEREDEALRSVADFITEELTGGQVNAEPGRTQAEIELRREEGSDDISIGLTFIWPTEEAGIEEVTKWIEELDTEKEKTKLEADENKKQLKKVRQQIKKTHRQIKKIRERSREKCGVLENLNTNTAKEEADSASNEKSETLLEHSGDETFHGSLGSDECRQSALPVNAHLDNLSVIKNSQEKTTANPSNPALSTTRQPVSMQDLTGNQEGGSHVVERTTPVSQNTILSRQQLS